MLKNLLVYNTITTIHSVLNWWCFCLYLEQILRINTKYNLLYLKGHGIPGPIHCYVRIFDTCLPNRRDEMLKSNNTPPMPTYIPEVNEKEHPAEYFDSELYQFTQPSIVFEEEKVQKKK